MENSSCLIVRDWDLRRSDLWTLLKSAQIVYAASTGLSKTDAIRYGFATEIVEVF